MAEATTRAISIYETVRAKVLSGEVVKNKNFKSLALEELDILAKQIVGKTGLHTFKDFKFVAERYLIPFFGKYQVSEITQQLIEDFESWRESEMGCDPKASTRRHHISAYNKTRVHSDAFLRSSSRPDTVLHAVNASHFAPELFRCLA